MNVGSYKFYGRSFKKSYAKMTLGKFFSAFHSKGFNRFSLGEITNLEYTSYPREIFFRDQTLGISLQFITPVPDTW